MNDYPIVTPLPSEALSFLVMPSIRSAAELKALTTALEAALARSAFRAARAAVGIVEEPSRAPQSEGR